MPAEERRRPSSPEDQILPHAKPGHRPEEVGGVGARPPGSKPALVGEPRDDSRASPAAAPHAVGPGYLGLARLQPRRLEYGGCSVDARRERSDEIDEAVERFDG